MMVLLCLSAAVSAAQTLSLPENLVNLNSDRARAELLLESEALRSYWPLSIHFETQKNQAFCGVASIVIVLNALGVPAPTTPDFDPYNDIDRSGSTNTLRYRLGPALTDHVLGQGEQEQMKAVARPRNRHSCGSSQLHQSVPGAGAHPVAAIASTIT
jgi:hypothetical protein